MIGKIGELKKDTRWWRAWTRKNHRTWKEKVALDQNWDKREIVLESEKEKTN